MKQQIKLMRLDGKDLIIPSKNPEYSSLYVGADTLGVVNGFLTRDKRRAYYTGKTEDIEAFVKEFNLSEGSLFPLDVKILIKESTTPFYSGQDAKMNPKTNEILTFEGAAIYRQCVLVDASSNDTDEKLVSDASKQANSVKEAAIQAENAFKQ